MICDVWCVGCGVVCDGRSEVLGAWCVAMRYEALSVWCVVVLSVVLCGVVV